MRNVLFFTVCMWLFISSCTQKEVVLPPFIQPPIPELDIPYTKFTINAEDGGEVKYVSGSVITFEGNSLVDSLGNLVKGEVEINYREFHDAVDILLSGISMDYDSGGVKNILQTAGMFDIRAYQNGRPVFIDSGKTVNVNMASFQTGDQYNFYSLDTTSRNWVYKGKPETTVNIKKVERLIPIYFFPNIDFSAHTP